MASQLSRKKAARRGSGRRGHKVALEGAMTIYQCVRDKRALLEALAQASELELDLSGVTELDTAGVQLLLLLKREAGRQGKQLRLQAHSPAVLETLNAYQLVAYFGDPVVISSRER